MLSHAGGIAGYEILSENGLEALQPNPFAGFDAGPVRATINQQVFAPRRVDAPLPTAGRTRKFRLPTQNSQGHAMLYRLLLIFLAVPANLAAGDALSRLTADRLAEITTAVQQLQAERNDLPRSGEFRDFRANLHVHSAFSHDSRGQIDDIVAAAHRAGTQVLMFSEHPADHYDFFADGHSGLRDGVLLIPGAEMRGFLCYPTLSLKGLDGGTNQEFTDLVCGRNGRMFICHLEERMDWQLAGITGTEIYNTHADFKDEKELVKTLRDPLWLFKTAPLFRQYPQAAYSALLDYPADYLRRYDELCRIAPHTGVAGNDAHQNVGLRIVWNSDGNVVVQDALEEPLLTLNADENPIARALTAGKRPGDELFALRIDPYECALRHVGTHLLMRELTQAEVWEALADGRAYVAFDWLCDATGFDFAAIAEDRRSEMGSQIDLTDGLTLRAAAPHPGHWRLVHNGETAVTFEGDTLEFPVCEPGVYRLEVSLDVAGETKPWILSNPIYIRAAAAP